MALSKFDGIPAEELSMVEVAREVLTDNAGTLNFVKLNQRVQDFIGLGDNDERVAQFYSDLNADGSFISLGNNEWGLRAWYPIDSINETIHDLEDEDNEPKRKKTSKKVNVFANNEDDDVIDYNDDDPEDADDVIDDTDDSNAKSTDSNYDKDDDDDDDSNDNGIEEALTTIKDDDIDDLGDGDEE